MSLRRLAAYAEPTRLDIIQVRMVRNAPYCPPPIEARWSPVVGGFVVRETGPARSVADFIGWAIRALIAKEAS